VSKTRINVEYVESLIEAWGKVNRLAFDDIEWFKNGQRLDVPQDVRDEFRFTGLSNIDFVRYDFIDQAATPPPTGADGEGEGRG
jgi:hypothetical protein